MQNEKKFSDVELAHPYSRYIWAVNKLGLMMGDGNGYFQPDMELSMQEFAVIAYRLIQYGKAEAVQQAATWRETNPFYEKYEQDQIDRTDAEYKERAESGYVPPAHSTVKVFADSDQIASWAKESVDEFSRWGILQGDSEGADSQLRPTEALSRTRFLVFMYKFSEKIYLYSHNHSEVALF
jgi:hypothetical protein